MKRRREALIQMSTAVLALAVAGRAAGQPAAARRPKTFTIVIDKMAFGPAPTDLRVGDTILWVNRDLFQHTATASDKSFDVDLPPGKSGKTQILRAGSVAFICRYHPNMKGKLVVHAAGSH